MAEGPSRAATETAASPDPTEPARSRREILAAGSRALIRAIQDGDEAAVETAVVQLSQSRRIFAPLVFAVGAFAMLFEGLRLLFSNWRLTLVQVLPAMWIWVAMLDLKLHAFKGHEFHAWGSVQQLALVVAIMLVTAAGFYLNAVFAFAISQPGKPRIRPAFKEARKNLAVVLGVGLVVGVIVGLTGVGGGSLMTPTLVFLFKIPVDIAVGTDLIFASLTKIAGVTVHSARGNVNWRIVTRLGAGSLPASIATIFLMSQLKAHGKPLDGIILPLLGISLVATAAASEFSQ